ncbi:MAG: L-histidine N(alpha)-methyltransferase [Pyrinomonadaceae bacterium]|nr:L-histidine N(alpha)-methyltransferase [Pyrinomonadaceae bacterium]
MQPTKSITNKTFAEDVLDGLSDEPKHLSSKYFYDDEGSRLFQEIMKLPEYYLTRSEYEIFRKQTEEIYQAFDANKGEFDLIELGAGDGIKTSLLVDYFLKMDSRFSYVPIDISSEALNFLTDKFHREFPNLDIQTERGDYFKTLETFKERSDKRKVILFLGSNIGNFSAPQALEFFRHLHEVMNKNDSIFIGFDLHKNPKTILNAYDDSLNVTARFNLNLLKRMNRELGANFETDNFLHYASYHPTECAARSYLISQKDHDVFIEELGREFHFKKWEPIYMEVSQKYNLEMIEELASNSGFEIVQNFYDENRFYSNSLWKPA